MMPAGFPGIGSRHRETAGSVGLCSDGMSLALSDNVITALGSPIELLAFFA
jgi:hypothetical protein